MREKPFRVIVWGPGRLGAICIREAALNPALELVGVRAYSEHKHGVDAGELIGIEPLGITASTDLEAMLAVECDAVIYSALDMGIYHTDDEIIRLLEAGRNVITTLPYQHLRAVRDDAFIARLQAACREGCSVFHATGVDPDAVCDRVLPALTTMCTDIRHVQIQENWDVGAFGAQTLEVIGFGQDPAAVAANADSLAFGDNYGTVRRSYVIPTASAQVPGNPNFEASYHAIAAPCLQAIPHVVKASPGILPVFHCGHHWVPDLRAV